MIYKEKRPPQSPHHSKKISPHIAFSLFLLCTYRFRFCSHSFAHFYPLKQRKDTHSLSLLPTHLFLLVASVQWPSPALQPHTNPQHWQYPLPPKTETLQNAHWQLICDNRLFGLICLSIFSITTYVYAYLSLLSLTIFCLQPSNSLHPFFSPLQRAATCEHTPAHPFLIHTVRARQLYHARVAGLVF